MTKKFAVVALALTFALVLTAARIAAAAPGSMSAIFG